MSNKKDSNDEAQSKPKRKHRGHGEGSITLRKDGRYQAQLTLENGKRRSLYGKTRKEVADKLNKALQEQKQGTLITATQQTLASFLEQWLDMKRKELKETTYCYYKYDLEKHVIPRIGHIKLQKLLPEHIQEMYTELLEELSSATVHTIHSMLKAALDLAVKWKKIPFNPCASVNAPRREKSERQFLDLEQAQRLIESAQKYWMIRALIPLALGTGMRRGEILALEWNDIDFETKTVKITKTLAYYSVVGEHKKYAIQPPKTENSKRTVSLPDFVITALQEHRIEQLQRRLAAPTWEHPELVFTNSKGGYYWHKILEEQFRSILRDAKLPRMPFHSLRHSAATILLAMKVDVNVVKERLGHADIRTTLGIYGHVTKSMQNEATDNLDAGFQKKIEE